MRTLSSALSTAQQSLNRKPNTKLIIRDVFLRLSQLTAGANSDFFPPALLAGIPYCPYDFYITSGGEAWRAWFKSNHLYVHCATGTLSDPASWAAGSISDLDAGILSDFFRPSLANDKLYYGDATQEKIYQRNLVPGGGLGGRGDFCDVTGMETQVALAATATGCYLAQLVESGSGSDFKYVKITKGAAGGGGGPQSLSNYYPSNAESDGGDGEPWSDPLNIDADDDTYASCNLPAIAQESEVLEARQFGFNIPDPSTILGVEVDVGKYGTWTTAYRKLVTVNWNAGAPAVDYPVCVVLDTAALVSAGKMKADCSDLVVVVDGTEANRWIADPNDANTKVWFNLTFTPAPGSQHTIYFYYDGGDAKAADDDYKPPFDLSASTNTSWDYLYFGGSSGDYSQSYAKWVFTRVSGGIVCRYYTEHHVASSQASPWGEAGISIVAYNTNACEGKWEITNVCGITDMAYQDGEYWQARPAGITTTLETIPAATSIELLNDSTWHAWSQTDNGLAVNTAGYKTTKDAIAGSQVTNLFVEMSRCTVTLDGGNTPTASVGAESSSGVAIRDAVVCVRKAATDGDNKATTGVDWPEDAEAETSYGGAADLWGLSLTVDEVNSDDFGVDVSVSVFLKAAVAYVDYIKVTVTYQPGVTHCPHLIVVDDKYTFASLTWFDAVALGNRDVIVVNRHAYGDPVVIFHEEGGWSDPQPILPADIVDNYTFLRISGMTVIADSDGDDVLWACGRIGRGGSSGLNSQEWDCVLRTKDGEHWTLDRFSYLCSNAVRSRLQVNGESVYYAGGDDGGLVMHGLRTWLLGLDNSDLKWTVENDILDWQYSQPGVNEPSSGTTSLADHHGVYKPYKSGGTRYGIWAGYWLWRYAGYNGHEVLLSTEGIDRTPASYRAGDRHLSLASRDIVMKSLIDWAGDQDWQWLSQQKLYDDCDQIDHLYSISGVKIDVVDGDYIGYVDQQEMEETTAEEIGFRTTDKTGIFLATKPNACRNYVVRATFRYVTNTNGRSLALGGSPQYLGFGFGVIGCVTDQFNLVAAYYDTKTNKLYILRRAGADAPSSSWEELASSAALAGSPAENQRNRIELHRNGSTLIARILRFTQGSDASVLATVSYTWAKTEWMNDGSDDLGHVGVLTNMDVTASVGSEYIYITDVEAYDADDPDKTLEWTLKDIAAKSGVMDFDTSYSVDETPFSGDDNPTGAVWLQDTNGSDLHQRDLDLTFTIPNQIQDEDSLVIIPRSNRKLVAAPTDGNMTSVAGCKITYLRTGGSWKVQFHQTTANPASSTKANWVLMDEISFTLGPDNATGGRRVRVVSYDDFFAIYINNRWIRTFHLGPIFNHVDDGWDNSMESAAGYAGVWRQGTTDWENLTVTQPELWTWTDGIILDQRMNALAGLMRTIRDRRVKFLTQADGSLKISEFTARDSLDTIGDQIFEDSDSPTDRVPTHIRVVGEEISDYIDHDSAAEWGLVFALAQCPSLAEQEGYAEAQTIASDAISKALGRQMSHAARVDWEPEDMIPVSYTPADGGPTVSDNFVVNAVSFRYRTADLIATAVLREDR